MNKKVLVLRSMGVGWILAVTIMMIIMPLDTSNPSYHYTIGEIIAYYAVFGFPGVMLLIASLFFALSDNQVEDDEDIDIKKLLKKEE